MISYHVMHHRILGIGKYPAGVSGSGIASALWLLPSYVCKGLYIYSMGRFSKNYFFFYLLLFCFCESCVMRVLQSKGVANHRETYRDPDGTNKKRTWMFLLCLGPTQAVLFQITPKWEHRGQRTGNEDEDHQRVLSYSKEQGEKCNYWTDSAGWKQKVVFIENQVIIIARPHNESTKSLAKTPSVKTGGGT